MKKKLIVSAIAAVCIIIVFVISAYLVPRMNYKRATQLYNEKEYVKASEIFLKLEDYKDSGDMYNKSQFNLAKDYVQQEKYDEALSCCKNSLHKEEITKLINKSKLNKSIQFINEENYYEAKNLLSQIGHITDYTDEQINKIYEAAIKLYNNGKFDTSNVFFIAVEKTIDVVSYKKNIEILQKIQGDWYGIDKSYYVWFRINGWELERFSKNLNDFWLPEKLTYNEETESLYSPIGGYTIYVENDTVYTKWIDDEEKTHIFKCQEKDIVPKKEPRIGMTAEEVRNSTWGSPKDINKHTYSWGIKEQWCYYGNKYIYLEDGIVTSISE